MQEIIEGDNLPLSRLLVITLNIIATLALVALSPKIASRGNLS